MEKCYFPIRPLLISSKSVYALSTLGPVAFFLFNVIWYLSQCTLIYSYVILELYIILRIYYMASKVFKDIVVG